MQFPCSRHLSGLRFSTAADSVKKHQIVTRPTRGLAHIYQEKLTNLYDVCDSKWQLRAPASIICLCNGGHLVQATQKGLVVSLLEDSYVLREIVNTGQQNAFSSLPGGVGAEP